MFVLDSAGEFVLDTRRRASEGGVLPGLKKPRLTANDTPGRRSADVVELDPWRGLGVDSSGWRGSMETYREETEERVSGGQRDRGQVFVSAMIVINADVGRPAGEDGPLSSHGLLFRATMFPLVQSLGLEALFSFS